MYLQLRLLCVRLHAWIQAEADISLVKLLRFLASSMQLIYMASLASSSPATYFLHHPGDGWLAMVYNYNLWVYYILYYKYVIIIILLLYASIRRTASPQLHNSVQKVADILAIARLNIRYKLIIIASRYYIRMATIIQLHSLHFNYYTIVHICRNN